MDSNTRLRKLKLELEQFKSKTTEQLEAKDKQIQILSDKLDAALSSNTINKLEHSQDHWLAIWSGCAKKAGAFGTDSIIRMIKTGKMTVNDCNPERENITLLMYAARSGAYELVQFLLNNGVNIDAKDDIGQTALTYARISGFSHIEKLLLFAKMNVEAGNEIKEVAIMMKRQNGINEVLSNELANIGKHSKKLYEETLMELMIRMIAKKKTFCDNQLIYAFNMALNENEHILKSNLWLQIRSTVTDIVKNGSMSDWIWLKQCLLPSTIWYKDISKDQNADPHYLYFELLKLVNVEAMNQINELDENMMKMANEQRNIWNELIEWQTPNEYESARQDVITNGIASQFTLGQLSATSGTTFNAPNFYDHNQYLSQLVLLAQMVDDDFQSSVQQIYGIGKVTNQGKILSIDDEKSEVGVVEYMRGPIKLIERARAKAQTDYFNEPYPASACVIDFNRCALIFDDISSLLCALKLFVNKVKYYQSGNIIGIARDKNGFIEYVKEAQYADIKLNVVIKGRHNSIIGEVQFLLRAMKEYKDKAHNLYAIQRKEEAMKSSVRSTLPLILNQQKEIISIACGGSVKRICSLMILQNQTMNDLMFVDKKSQQTIINKACRFGHLRLLLFLESMMSKKEFIDHIFLSDAQDKQPIEYAFDQSQSSVVKYLVDKKEVQQRYKKNDPLIFRLCIYLFACNSNWKLAEYVISALQIKQEKVVQMMSYKCPQQSTYQSGVDGAREYHKYTLLTTVPIWSNIAHFQQFVSFVGEQAFIDNVFNVDGWNKDAMRCAVERTKRDFIKYMLEFDEIREKYMSDNDLLFRLCQVLNERIGYKDIVHDIVDKLDLTEAKLNELKSFRKINVDKIVPFTK